MLILFKEENTSLRRQDLAIRAPPKTRGWEPEKSPKLKRNSRNIGALRKGISALALCQVIR